ncbi:polysaccharide pyruvyl transferase family protein [Faecalicatena contorta]|uniref:polysaccharide pyruvyl transferase family protein n=1 Tax=Faecalicatena contorta TaxID=39482 RepID=UPI001960F13B|nr:polysaccharide pyruvyl transferase family protein [Faecalicatena contorta]MBM6684746.1 polysaccharide pyruvyl transferase family protein [Faecalicatena contorta]MBM6710072.1 polysaccharide pyruvyl transferase family protein [Faecalicatena contorta]
MECYNYKFYMHTGSENHGCEAIVRTLSSIIGKDVKVYTKNIEEDKKYIDDPHIFFQSAGNIPPLNSWDGAITRLKIKGFKQKYAFVKPAYKNLINESGKDTVAFSIGGDNYCYDGMPNVLAILNRELNKKGAKTILYGCSLEPELLKNNQIIADLNRYCLIVPRESITYNALITAGLGTKTILASDPAFILPKRINRDIDQYIGSNTVGINLSPLVLEANNTILYEAYSKLLDWIVRMTDMNIALIPHVIWDGNDDRIPLRKLYNTFRDTGRITFVEDHNAMELKGYISKCRFFVGARTHATIAAYSTCVPTLVAGYSVKSKGIARDIFGTDQNYVVDTTKLTSDDALLHAFQWLYKEEKNIRKYLTEKMPKYISTAYFAKNIIKTI